MKYAIAISLAFLAVVLDGSVAPYIKVLGVSPGFVLVFVACWAMVRGQSEAMVIVPVAGLLRDLTTTDPVGMSMLALSPIVLMSAVREIRPVESDFVPALAVVAVGSLAYAVISMTVLTIVGNDVLWGTGLLRFALPTMVVNSLFAVLVYPPVRWLSPRPRTESYGVGSAVQL